MSIRVRVAVGVALLAAVLGCEPITVSVAPDGRVAFTRAEGIFAVDLEKETIEILLDAAGKDSGQPTLVRWSPDAKKVAYVLIRGSGFGENHELFLRSEDGSSRSLFRSDSPILYLKWAPDGKRLSFTCADTTGQSKGAILHLVDAASGKDEILVREVSAVHHWTPEGWIVLFQVEGEHKEGSGLFVGQIATVDPAGGEVKGHVHAASGQSAWLTVSPDGKKVSFVAVTASDQRNGLKLPGENDTVDTDETRAFVYDFGAKTLETFAEEIVYFLLDSPDGRRVAYVSKGEDDKKVLKLRGGTGEDQVLDPEVVTSASKDMAQVPLYYAWIDANRLFYWKEKVVYGRTATSIAAHVVDVGSGKRRSVQHVIDRLVAEKTE